MTAAAPMPGMRHMQMEQPAPGDTMPMQMAQHDTAHMRVPGMVADSGHDMSNMSMSRHGMSETMSNKDARRAMLLVIQLLSDPQIEARIQRDPQLRQLWNDPGLQECLRIVKQMRAAGQQVPVACPAWQQPNAPTHEH